MSVEELTATLKTLFAQAAPFVGGTDNANNIAFAGVAVAMVIYIIAFIFRTGLPGSGRAHFKKLARMMYSDKFAVCSCMHPQSEEEFFPYLHEDCKTLPDIFIKRGLSQFTHKGKRNAVGVIVNKSIHWTTYEGFRQRVLNLSHGLMRSGVKVNDNLIFGGIIGRNNQEYLLGEHALMYLGIVCVHYTDAFGLQSLHNMLLRTYPKFIVATDPDKFRFLVDFAPKSLKYVIVAFDIDKKLKRHAIAKGVKMKMLAKLEKLGGKKPMKKKIPPEKVTNSTFCSVYFTANHSETLRAPILTHANLLGAMTGIAVHLDSHSFHNSDVYFAYLPRRITMETLLQNFILMEGGRVVHYSGKNINLFKEMRKVSPTVLLTVPRLLNQIFDRFGLSCCGQCPLTNLVLFGKVVHLKKGDTRTTLFDRLKFMRMRSNFGPRLRMLIVTGGPIRQEVLTFTRAALGCVVLTNYGACESSGTGIMSFPSDNHADSVGVPLPCTQARIVDIHASVTGVDKALRKSKSPIGEIAIKGVNLAKQYCVLKGGAISLGAFDSTLLVSDARGYYRTNDYGRLYPNGNIQCLTRKNHIYKNPQGQWICVEKIERILEKRCSMVKQIFITVPRYHSWPAGIVDIHVSEVQKECGGMPFEQMVKNVKAKMAVVQHLQKVGREAGFQTTQIPIDVILIKEKLPMTRLRGITVKDRQSISIKYKKELRSLYNKLGSYDSLYGVVER